MPAGHYGRAVIFKLALADAQLLAEMHDPGSVEFEAARNAAVEPVTLNELPDISPQTRSLLSTNLV